MVHHVRLLHHQRLRHDAAEGQANEVRPTLRRRRPADDRGETPYRIVHREGSDGLALSMLGEVGGQAVELFQSLELRHPHPATEGRAVQEEQDRLTGLTGLVNVQPLQDLRLDGAQRLSGDSAWPNPC